jgi:hypothetical protein
VSESFFGPDVLVVLHSKLPLFWSERKRKQTMTLQEKYDLALACLRKLAKMGMDGSVGGYSMDPADFAFFDGVDSGLSQAGNEAEACLHEIGEKLS